MHYLDMLSLKFVVPVDGATESMTIGSDITWDEFIYKMAGDMGVRRDFISLAYRFSTMAKKDLPRALTKPTHFAALWEDACKEVTALEIKKKSSKSTKPLKVLLVDRTPKSSKEDGTKSAVILAVFTTGIYLLILYQGRGKTKQSDGPNGLVSEEKKKADYLLQLQAKLQCDTHRTKFCYVMSDGKHRHLTTGDLSWWAMALVRQILTSKSTYANLYLSALRLKGSTNQYPSLLLISRLRICDLCLARAGQHQSLPLAVLLPFVPRLHQRRHPLYLSQPLPLSCFLQFPCLLLYPLCLTTPLASPHTPLMSFPIHNTHTLLALTHTTDCTHPFHYQWLLAVTHATVPNLKTPRLIIH